MDLMVLLFHLTELVEMRLAWSYLWFIIDNFIRNTISQYIMKITYGHYYPHKVEYLPSLVVHGIPA